MLGLLRRGTHGVEPRLLLVAQRSVELLKLRANGLHRIHHRAEPRLDCIEPRRRSLRHVGWAGCLELASGLFRRLLEFVEGALLLRIGLNHLLNALHGHVREALPLLTTHRRQIAARSGRTLSTSRPAGAAHRDVFKGEVLPGEQPAILERELFDAVQAKLNEQRNNHTVARSESESVLIGRIYDDRGNRMTPSHVRNGGIKYRYYLSSPLLHGQPGRVGSVRRVPAAEIEALVGQAEPNLVQAAVEGRLPRGIGVARLRDAPAEWSRQYAMLGLSG